MPIKSPSRSNTKNSNAANVFSKNFIESEGEQLEDSHVKSEVNAFLDNLKPQNSSRRADEEE